MKLDDFMEQWSLLVPHELADMLDVKLLGGMAIQQTIPEPVVRYFPVESLSNDKSTRFAQLFAAVSTWTREEIEPYITEFRASNCTIDQLLMKHTRAITNRDGSKSYTYVPSPYAHTNTTHLHIPQAATLNKCITYFTYGGTQHSSTQQSPRSSDHH